MPRGIPNKKPEGDGGQPNQIPAKGFELPENLKGQPGAIILLEACNVYGVNPDTTLPVYAGRGRGPFRELMGWRFYPGNDAAGIPDCVQLVTVGGTKVRYYADPDFPMDPDENRLRQVFHAFKTDPNTKQIIALPLPDDLTLPRAAVSSQVDPDHGHQYQSGYLRRKPDDARNKA